MCTRTHDNKKLKMPDSKVIDTSQSVVFIGANGSGKTRLGCKIQKLNNSTKQIGNGFLPIRNCIRVTAQKDLNCPDKVGKTTLQEAEQEFNQTVNASINNHTPVSSATDYGNIVSMLFAELDAVKNEVYDEYRSLGKVNKKSRKPKIEQVKAIWELVLPKKQLIIGNCEISCSHINKNNDYPCSQMSDGERVLLYIIGQSLFAPENGIIIIDEPELHLHKSLMYSLWAEIEKARPDLLFVYFTHDIDFALTRDDSKLYWIKSYDGNNWEYEEVIEHDGLPVEALLPLLGSRKPILLVEGEKDSYDTKLYRLLFGDYNVVACGSCTEVIKQFRLIKKAPEQINKIYTFNVHAIIDRDRRSDSEIIELREEGICVLEVAEVENLFLTEELINYLTEKMCLNDTPPLDNIKSKIKKLFTNDLEEQLLERTKKEVQYLTKALRDVTSIDEIKNQFTEFNISQKVDSYYNEQKLIAISAKDSGKHEEILKFYNKKHLHHKISSELSIISRQYQDSAIRFIKNEGNDSKKRLINRLKKYFDGNMPPVNSAIRTVT